MIANRKSFKGNIALVLIVTILSLILFLPCITQIRGGIFPDSKINLGLDLRGGSNILFEVDFEEYLSSNLDNLVLAFKKNFRQNKISYQYLAKINDNEISFNLLNVNDFEKVKKIIKDYEKDFNIALQDKKVIVKYEKTKINQLLENLIEQSIEVISLRVNATGTKETTIQKQGDKYILLQVPGEDNPAELKKIIGKTARLSFHLVDEQAMLANSQQEQGAKNENDEKFKDRLIIKNTNDSEIILYKTSILSGDQLLNAKVTFGQYSEPAVGFSFNKQGSEIFAEITKTNIGKRLAIVLDNKLLSAPVINQPILGGDGVISGNFTIDSANELAVLLNAGALPAPLKIIEERVIGPTLGIDSIEGGKKAAVYGFTAVVIFMILIYGILGFFAIISLTASLLYIMASLTLLDATLTLPGIAGIVLTIGMAVDANILIYERIREELRKKHFITYSVKVGFKSALTTILDSNITTLIAALVLYIFGFGPIKGFAVTLAIGIICSMFAAIIITKLLVDLWISYIKPQKLPL